MNDFTKADDAHCRKCKWHGTYTGSTTAHPICRYSDEHDHSRVWLHYQRTGTEDLTTMKSGVGCHEFDDGKLERARIRAEQIEQAKRKSYENRFVPLDVAAFQELKANHTWMEIAGTIGVRNIKMVSDLLEFRRIRNRYANSILEAYGVEVRAEKPKSTGTGPERPETDASA